jgi:hypothetical protein
MGGKRDHRPKDPGTEIDSKEIATADFLVDFIS